MIDESKYLLPTYKDKHPEPLTYDEDGKRSFPYKSPDTKCNGKVKKNNRYCQLPAGYGTSHEGSGRCVLHDGDFAIANTYKNGLTYSNCISSEVIEAYEEMCIQPDVHIKNINGEIALLRAKIVQLESSNKDGKNDRAIGGFLTILKQYIELKTKAEDGLKQKVVVDVVYHIVDDVLKVLDNRIADASLKRLIATDLKKITLPEEFLN